MTDAVILDARSQLRFTLPFARAKCIKRSRAKVHFAVSSAKFDIYKTTKCYYSKHFHQWHNHSKRPCGHLRQQHQIAILKQQQA